MACEQHLSNCHQSMLHVPKDTELRKGSKPRQAWGKEEDKRGRLHRWTSSTPRSEEVSSVGRGCPVGGSPGHSEPRISRQGAKHGGSGYNRKQGQMEVSPPSPWPLLTGQREKEEGTSLSYQSFGGSPGRVRQETT